MYQKSLIDSWFINIINLVEAFDNNINIYNAQKDENAYK